MFKRLLILLPLFLFVLSFQVKADGSTLNYMPVTPEQIGYIFAQFANNYMFSTSVDIYNNGTLSQNVEISSNDSLIQLIDKYQDANLQQLAPSFNPNSSQVTGVVNLRGVFSTVQTSFTVVNGERYENLYFCSLNTCLSLTQDLGPVSLLINSYLKTLHALTAATATSTESIWDQLVDWLKGQGGTNLLQQIAKAWVSDTSIDPVAGNPNSLMAVLTRQNFNLAMDGVFDSDPTGLNLFSLTPSYYQSDANGFTTRDAVLPLKWSHYFDQDNGLFIDAPLTFDEIQSAQSYSLALGIGYSHVFIRNHLLTWAVVPSIYSGITGSVDMASGTLMYDGGIASRLIFPTDKITYGITNDVSYLQTATVTIGNVTTPYNVKDVLTANGVDATYNFNPKYSLGGYYKLTNVIGGSTWYMPNYNDVGIKLAKSKTWHNAVYNFMTMTLGYTFGPHKFNAGNVTFGFNF